MTVSEIRKFTTDNSFDTIMINGKPKAEYAARRFLFEIVDQNLVIATKVVDEVLHLEFS